MEGLGGSISAENHPDGGAEFIIHMPISNSGSI
jgi:signal transduction histidine kinase